MLLSSTAMIYYAIQQSLLIVDRSKMVFGGRSLRAGLRQLHKPTKMTMKLN